MRKLLLPIAVLLGLALPAPGLAATVAVKIGATGFTPKTVTVNQGDTVKWTNADNVNHQLVANNGAFASAIAGAPRDLAALPLADSVAVDPHKWLYAPLEAGCILARDPEKLRNAFAYHPPYYHFGEEATNYVDFGPQNSRGFRALKVWLALRQVGRDGYVQMIAEDVRLSKQLFASIAAHPELEAWTHGLSITTFRYVPADLRTRSATEPPDDYLNTLNKALLERIQASGEMFVSNAVVRGRFLLRACIVNFHTGGADVAAVSEITARLGREVDAALRSSGGDV